jgi:toxin ParE1/3/4
VRYELSARARADVKAIIAYTLEHFGDAQTDDYLEGLYYSFDLLTDNPQLGRRLEGDVRYYVYRSHYVFYEIRGDVLRIATIRSTRQPWPEEWRK